MERVIFYTTFVTALGSGLIAGTFFIFSAAIMSAFRRLPASEGMAAMQSINVVIINPIFLGVFLATGVLSAVLTIFALLRWELPSSGFVVAGAALYLLGSLLVTMTLNVPLNDALANANPQTTAGQEVWQNYLSRWTFWNHVRTIASLAASASFILALTANR